MTYSSTTYALGRGDNAIDGITFGGGDGYDFRVGAEGVDAPEPPLKARYSAGATRDGADLVESHRENRTVTIPFRSIEGTDMPSLRANIAALRALLSDADRYARTGEGRPVVLTIKRQGENTPLYLDVFGGSFPLPPSATTKLWRDLHMIWQPTLTLTTRPFARGDAVTIAATATRTNNAGAWQDINDVPGDVPALYQLAVEDQSTSGAINRLLVNVRHGAQGGNPSSAVFARPGVAAGIASDVAEPNSLDGVNVRRVTPGGSWSDVASLLMLSDMTVTRAWNFDPGIGSWVGAHAAAVTHDTTTGHGSAGAMKIVTPGGIVEEGATVSGVTATGGQDSIVKAWVFAPAGTTLRLQWDEYDGGGGWLAYAFTGFTGTGGWQQVSHFGTLNASTAKVDLSIRTNTSAQAKTFWADDVRFGASPGVSLAENSGLLRVLLRVRDRNGLAPPALSSIYRYRGGSLTTYATYYYCVTATNASGETVASGVGSVTTNPWYRTHQPRWTQVSGATGYRVYRKTGASGTWGYIVVSGGSVTGFTDNGNATPTTGDPPTAGSAVALTASAQWRIKHGFANEPEDKWITSDVLPMRVGGNAFELVGMDEIRANQYPPRAVPTGYVNPGYIIKAEARLSGNVTGDVDCDGFIILHQHGHYAESEYSRNPDVSNTQHFRWVFDQTADEQLGGMLVDPATNTPVGQVSTTGALYLLPGENRVFVTALQARNIHDVSSTKFTLSGYYVPRYLEIL